MAKYIEAYFKYLSDRGGSDLHIASGARPMIRLHGEMVAISDQPLSAPQVITMMKEVLPNEEILKLKTLKNVDFAVQWTDPGPIEGKRYRGNAYIQKNGPNMVFRAISTKIPYLKDLGLPEDLERFTHFHKGLILVTGATGSGKSSTVAALINIINETRHAHIITIEDPIEFVHNHKLSIINQRELGMDTKSFSNALRASLREDPDVILVGEMRDLETVALAVSAAETGHLVFGTLHTNSAASSVDRMVDIFPPGQQGQVRLQLSNNLQAIISQQLIPCTPGYQAQTGRGRVAAQEIMIANPAIRNLIREAKAHQITSIIQTSANIGMITTDACLRKLYNEGKISYENALSRAQNEEELKRMLAGQEADGSSSPRPGGGPPQRPPGR